MKLASFCIDRPVFASVLSLVLVLFGILGFSFLSVRYMPQTFRPHMRVQVTYPGASAELMEQSITDKIENALASTPNLEDMDSNSTQGQTQINLHFSDITQEQFLSVQADVIREVSEIDDLPQAANKPSISNSSDDNFVMVYDLYDPNMTPVELSGFLSNTLAKSLQRIPGVGNVQVDAFDSALRVDVSPQKLSAYNLTINDVLQALKDNNVAFSVGYILNKTQQIPIDAKVSLTSIDAFKNLVIANLGQRLVYLKNVASVAMGPLSPAGHYFKIDGIHPGVGLEIYAADDANPIAVGERIRQAIQQLAPSFPPDLKVYRIFDLTSSLHESVKEVFRTVFEAIILVSLMVLLFIGRWKSAVIPIVTIPVCLIATFAAMYLLGFSINVLTLMAIVLAVGMVVDDAIVVMENSHRHVELGLDAKTATKKSLNEISFAVIAMTICLLAVYVPTAFMHGATATRFQAFAFTLAGSVLISGFVALTLSPAMCARLLKRHELNRYERWLESGFECLKRYYHKALLLVLKLRWLAVVLFFVLVIVGIKLFSSLTSSLLPKDPANAMFVAIQGPQTASVQYIHQLAKPVLDKIGTFPDVNHYTVFGGGATHSTSNSLAFVGMKPWYTLKHPAQYTADKINDLISNTPGITGGAFVFNINGSNDFNSGSEMSFLVLGMGSYQQLAADTGRFADALKQTGVFSDVNNDLKFDRVQYDVNIDRNLAQELGVKVSDITQALTTFFGGPQLQSQFQVGSQSYPIVVQLPRTDLADFSILQKINVKNNQGTLVPLSRFVTVKPVLSLNDRAHYNQMRAASVGVNLANNITMGKAVQVIEQVAWQSLPVGMQIAFQGEARHMLKSNHDMALIFVMGLCFIYLVLAALFESFLDPLIVLLTVPLCIVGALFALNMIGASLNVFTGIGLVTLIGLVSKHGILITQFANQLRQQGLALEEAILQAAAIRLRPILMTTLTMILGALPLVFSSGPGAIGRNQIGWVIVSGLLVGTIFSLFVVPVAYRLLGGLRRL
jgi:multidrug efflux pump